MISSKKVLGIVCVLSSLTQFAHAECPGVPGVFSNVSSITEGFSGELPSCETAESFGQIAKRLNSWFSAYTIAPMDELILIKEGSDGIGYYRSGRMKVPELFQDMLTGQLASADGMSARDKASMVFAHEWGHKVLFDLMAQKLPTFKQVKDRSEELYQMFVDSAMAQEQGAADAGKKKAEYEKQRKLFDKSELYQLGRMSIAYEELFGDLLAVLYSKKASVMSDVHQLGDMMETDQELGKLRDFGADIKVEGWSESEPHALFSPVRSWLGKKINFAALDEKQQALWANKVLNAIILELDFYLKNPGKFNATSVAQKNQALINKLQAQAK